MEQHLESRRPSQCTAGFGRIFPNRGPRPTSLAKSRRMRKWGRMVSLCLIGQVSVQTLGAQTVGFVAGASFYRLNSRGQGIALGAYGLRSAGRAVSFVLSVPVLSDVITAQAGTITSEQFSIEYFPEVRVEVAAPLGRLSPFVGGGAGIGVSLNGPLLGGATIHGIGGTRIALSKRSRLIVAVLARAVRPWRGRTIDVLVGFELARRQAPQQQK